MTILTENAEFETLDETAVETFALDFVAAAMLSEASYIPLGSFRRCSLKMSSF